MKQIITLLIALFIFNTPATALVKVGVGYMGESKKLTDSISIFYGKLDLPIISLGYMIKERNFSRGVFGESKELNGYHESIVYIEKSILPTPMIKPVIGIGYAFRSLEEKNGYSTDDGLIGYLGMEFGVPSSAITISTRYWIETIPISKTGSEDSILKKNVNDSTLSLNVEYQIF